MDGKHSFGYRGLWCPVVTPEKPRPCTKFVYNSHRMFIAVMNVACGVRVIILLPSSHNKPGKKIRLNIHSVKTRFVFMGFAFEFSDAICARRDPFRDLIHYVVAT